QSSFHVETVYASPDWLRIHDKTARAAKEIITTGSDAMTRISSLVSPPEVLAVARIPDYSPDITLLRKNCVLLLDGIRDPGNMGAIIRIAEWFGISDIICSPDCAEIWNPKVVQASMGSVLRVRAHEKNLPEFLRSAIKKGSPPVYGAYLEGKSIYKTTFPQNCWLVIGNESSGISRELEDFITEKITIPPFLQVGNRPESLNAAIATAIICAEIRRSSLKISD
ncbi:MAG TPA: RNA methyltransferase, partial [Bacteroidia bacterium]|nr:RNA methyltransferase [Bacteroidia bacterium]